MKIYIDEMKKLYTAILEFIENSNDQNNDIFFEKIIKIIKIQQIERDREEMKQFLQIIKSISDQHHRERYFIKRIYQIIQYYKLQIKQKFTNYEIFQLFKSNKLILLFLLNNDIITISETIYNEMMDMIESNGNRYCYFFYPEIEQFIGEERMKDVKNELIQKNPTVFENYEEKRQEGENDSYICSLIRQDSVVEFISYINRSNISVTSHITNSIFETNSFLIERNDTELIEYSAFFGSIQIFQYLMFNKVELNPSLWLYVIHSQNAELIHLLESNKIYPTNYSNYNYIQCLIESIKCHHNDFVNYIQNNLFIQKENDSHQKEKIILKYLKYHNYSLFETNELCCHGFFYLCLYNYNKLVDILLKMKENEIINKIISIKIKINRMMISNNLK